MTDTNTLTPTNAATAGMEPVAWIEVHPGLDGWFLAYSFNPDAQTEPLYSGFQVQAMLAAVPRNAPLYSPDDVAFPVQRCADGTDALPPELASTAAAEVAAPSAPGEQAMSDKELLELAAKAAGIELISWTNMYDACDEIGGRFITRPRGEPWNPLADDGDALRLVFKLGLRVCIDNRAGFSWIKKFEGSTAHGDDAASATRRAIVRAAAEIGKTMP